MNTYTPPTIFCGQCGAKMEIAAWWMNGMPREFFALTLEEWPGAIPCPNRAHPCRACGHVWYSTDGLEVVPGPDGRKALRWFVWPI